MAEHQERIGQHVGDYRLLRWLGGGGFGNVYLAEHTRDHRHVALKVLQMRLGNPDDLRSFINEARMFRLRHPHIMPLLDLGISRQDEPFLVMDYAPSGTLRDRHPKGERVVLPTIVDYTTQVASALHYAHTQHVVHRDVKPENMLLLADGTVLLSDFGIATAAHSTHSLSANAGVGGTVPYMAPEQLDGKPRAASDQYALAIVIYEWLTGRCPFVGPPHQQRPHRAHCRWRRHSKQPSNENQNGTALISGFTIWTPLPCETGKGTPTMRIGNVAVARSHSHAQHRQSIVLQTAGMQAYKAACATEPLLLHKTKEVASHHASAQSLCL